MKRKQREINPFSMSAVDLFASAMGAFILLAVIALPFFPKTADVVVDTPLPTPTPVPQVCPDPSPVPECPPIPAETFVLPDLDMIIVLDITGSMDDSIDGLKSTITDLTAVLNRLAPSFAVGVVTYGDYGYSTPVQSFQMREIRSASDIEDLTAFVMSIQNGWGTGSGDNNTDGEAMSAGLQAALSMRFRADSTERQIIVFTDDYPSYQQRAIDAVREFHSGSSSGVSQTVSIVSPRKLDSAKTTALSAIAEAGGGSFEVSAGSFMGKLLLTLLGS